MLSNTPIFAQRVSHWLSLSMKPTHKKQDYIPHIFEGVASENVFSWPVPTELWVAVGYFPWIKWATKRSAWCKSITWCVFRIYSCCDGQTWICGMIGPRLQGNRGSWNPKVVHIQLGLETCYIRRQKALLAGSGGIHVRSMLAFYACSPQPPVNGLTRSAVI